MRKNYLILPIILLVIYWLIFELFGSEWIMFLSILSLAGMIYSAYINNSKISYTVIMLIIYNVINYLFVSLFCSAGWFLSDMDGVIFCLMFGLFSILYFIIYIIRRLILKSKN